MPTGTSGFQPRRRHPDGILLGGRWLVLPDENRIVAEGREHRIPDKFMQVLLHLVEHPGVVTRRELLAAVWPDSVVVEESLTRAISELRKVLGDDPRRPRVIETIPKKGYRLLVTAAPAPPTPRTAVRDDPAASPPSGRRRSRRLLARRLGLAVALAAVSLVAVQSLRARREAAPAPVASIPLTSFPGIEEYPSLCRAGDRLAFVWEGDEHEPAGVYVKVVGATESRRITDREGHFAFPTWSPDSRHIAYVRVAPGDSGIFAVPATGGAERKLVGTRFGFVPAAPEYSPDGRRLAFIARTHPEGRWGIHMLDLATGDIRRLTAPAAEMDWDWRPRFCPDGRTLACLRCRAGEVSLALLPVAGGEAELLSAGERLPVDLAWTPDGRRLLFTATDGLWELHLPDGDPRLVSAGTLLTSLTVARDVPLLAFTEASGEWNIWELVGDGAEGGALHPSRLIGSSRRDVWPAISPDGRTVAFVSDRTGLPEVWLADADGTRERRLSRLESSIVGDLAWSPDGTRLACAALLDGHARICLLDPATGDALHFTPAGQDEHLPGWSADGAWIYFASSRSGSRQIWKRPLAGGEALQVTTGGGWRARESLDGTRVYFTRRYRDTTGLWSVPVGGGPETLEVPLAAGELMDWDLDEDGIYLCGNASREDEVYQLERRRYGGGSPEWVADLTSRRDFRIDVDRRSGRILFDRTERLESDIVGIRNY